MPTLKVPLNNFQFGEISSSLSSRTDIPIYNNSGEEIRNFWIRSEGGLLKRSGTKYQETIGEYIFPAMTITINLQSDDDPYEQRQLGNSFTLTTPDGSVHKFQMMGSSTSNSVNDTIPSASVGNTHFFRKSIDQPNVTNNALLDSQNATLENIRRRIDVHLGGISEFTASIDTSSASHVLTIKRTAVGNANLKVTTTEPQTFLVEDFFVCKMEFRLEPFVFSDDEKYLIIFRHYRIYFYRINNDTGEAERVTELAAAWLLNEKGTEYVPELTLASKGDVIFIAHTEFPTKLLRRTSLTTFEIVDYAFDQDRLGHKIYQPYFAFQSAGITITTSGSNPHQGNVTLTTSSPYFVLPVTGNNGSVGTDLLIHNTRCRITQVNSTTVAEGTFQGVMEIQLEIDSLRSTEGSAIITITDALHGMTDSQGITVTRAGSVGGIPFNNINGARTVSYVDENTYEISADSNATSSAIGGGTPRIKASVTTVNWQEASYSHLRGYPAAVEFHQNRLWFGGSPSQPDGIWASRAGNFFNFDIGDGEDSDAIDMTSNVGSISQIRHLVSNRDLQVFTADSELYIQAPPQKPITPSNAQILKQTPFGSGFVKPQPFDGATLFVQQGGEAVREFLFTDQEDAYTSVAISAYAPHLIRQPVQQTVIKGALSRSENYAFFVNQDGTIALFYSVRGEKKAGWTLWDTRGVWHSVCSVRENLYVIAIREIGQGMTRVILEKFDEDMRLDYGRNMNAENKLADTFVGNSGRHTIGSNGGDIVHINVGKWANITGVNVLAAQASANAVANITAHQRGLYGNYLQTLDVINGNDYLGSFTTPAETSTSSNNFFKFLGRITVDNVKDNVRNAQIGYAFTPKLKTLPVDAQVANGPLTGEPREISKVIVDFNSTLSAQIKAPNETSTGRDLAVVETNSDFSQEKVPFTGRKEFRTLGYSEDPRLIISQVTPLDLQVNGVIVEVAY